MGSKWIPIFTANSKPFERRSGFESYPRFKPSFFLDTSIPFALVKVLFHVVKDGWFLYNCERNQSTFIPTERAMAPYFA